MHNLMRMDLLRMRKTRSIPVLLILSAVFAFAQTPLAWGLTMLGRALSVDSSILFPRTAPLNDILASPFPFLNGMLTMLAACYFFYGDIEFGYVKNIAGQMPRRGYTVLSKFLSMILLNAAFALTGILFSLLGTVILQQIVVEEDLAHSVVILLLKLLLMQACCSILLLVTTGLRSKSLGAVLAVLLGTGLLSLFYLAIDTGLEQLFKHVSISPYMPDQLLNSGNPKALDAVLSGAITIAIFLPLSIRVFDRRDVK